VAQTNPPGRFDYLFDDLAEPDEDIWYEARPRDAHARERVPWYLTTPAVLAMIAITLAVVAIVVCAVLLVARQSRGPAHTGPPVTATTSTTTTSTTTTATTATTAATTPSPSPSSPPPAPPPSPTDAASTVIAPANPPRPPAKPPGTGVNRTPITRMPISVAPAPHPAFPRY
jgi:cytoskeletal protein RodZ